MKHSVAVAMWLLMFAGSAHSQAARTSLTGTVSSYLGAAVANAPVQAKNEETGAVVRAISSQDGRYTLSGLSAGSYQVSIAMPCCVFAPFRKEGIRVESGQAVRFDIRLGEGDALKTLGDDPGTLAAMVRKRSRIPKQPIARLKDGRPDFSGVWLINEDLYPEEPAALPWAATVVKERIENNFKDHPHTRCLPSSPPVPGADLPFMAKLVHTPSLLVTLFEDVPGFRQIYHDGRKHPQDPDPTWLGHAIGTWEGDTLVVDTIGFNDRGWIGRYPRTEKLHIVERYRRPDFGHLEVKITIEDPGVFTKPWNWNQVWDLAPQEELIEYVCENNKAQNMVGK